LKTIKEIAENTGVSKTSIYNFIQRNQIKTLKQQGVTYLDEVGEKLITAYYSSERQETIDDIITETKGFQSFQSNFQDSKDGQLEDCRRFISILEGELKEKNDTIKGLIQALTADKINESRRLLLQENQQIRNEFEEAPIREGFFKRIFRKK
jgi:DNA-binding MurR/RpiR family transcriptional regulator